VAQPVTPMHPATSAQATAVGSVEVAPVDDDDAVIVPAPSMESLGHAYHAPVRQRNAVLAETNFKRTLIPIELTLGVLLPVFGVAKFFLDPDAPIAQLPNWMSFAIIAVGPLLLGIAVVNMLRVQKLMAGTVAPKA
jgi:hypothetical protein